MQSFRQLIVASRVLNSLVQHCQTLKQLNKIFQASLSAPLNQHCHVANLRETTLVIHSDSSLWATRLRYMTPELLQQWQEEQKIPVIDKVEVKVRPLK